MSAVAQPASSDRRGPWVQVSPASDDPGTHWRHLVLGVLLLALSPAWAGDLRGRLQLTDLGAFERDDSLADVLGAQRHNEVTGDLRLIWEPRWAGWALDVHYQLVAEAGGGVKLRKDETAYFPEPPPGTLFDLSDRLVDTDHTRLTHRIDRLALGYATPDLVVRLGRQALTWGAGILFHPMDLVDPFAPDSIESEYKPGVDMLYVQRLFDDGSDLQLITVPRAARSGGPVTLDASTLALYYQKALDDLGTSWMLAWDQGDWTAGIGLSGALGGALWNLELIPTHVADGATKTSLLANISHATTLFERNATLFGEYFHNGFGVVGNNTTLATLPADLTERLVRGQLFNSARDYLAAGMTLEWTPLLSIEPTLIVNLNDGSWELTTLVDWSLTDNRSLIVGMQLPFGPRGSEYGGLPLSGNTAPYVAPSRFVYLQLRQYF